MAKDFTIKLDKRKLEALERAIPGRADDLVETLAREGERIVKLSFNTSPPGRSYKLPYKGKYRIHIASRPGYPPNVDTGKLMNAIYVYKPRERVRVISTGDTEYARPLEYGTTRMQARPFMRPMIVKLRVLVAPTFKRLIRP